MAFYRFGDMSFDEAKKIAGLLGLEKGDPYEPLLAVTNGGRFEPNDEHGIYVRVLDRNIWIDVLYGNTDNYRSDVFFWNHTYCECIPKNAIIIGDTQNNGFLVYIYDDSKEDLEKGIYYWDDSYTLDCSNDECNAYFIANNLETLFKNAKFKNDHIYSPKKRCKPNKEFGEDNMICVLPDNQIITIDAEEYKNATHKCKEIKVKYEFSKNYFYEDITREGIKKVEENMGYTFCQAFKDFVIPLNADCLKCNGDNPIIFSKDKYVLNLDKFDECDFGENAFYKNVRQFDVGEAAWDNDLERAEALQELHKRYLYFAYDTNGEKFAFDMSDDSIVAINYKSLEIKKIADDFDGFIKVVWNKEKAKKCKQNNAVNNEIKNKKVFEDYFAELHTDMVDICMEYVDYDADKIYIYCCCEGRTIHNDYFYEIEGQIVERYRVNAVSPRNTATPENEDKCLDILIDDVRKLKKLCLEYQRPMPTEIKMIYDVKKNSLDVKYKYDNQWLNHKTRTSDDILAEWFEEVKNSKQ